MLLNHVLSAPPPASSRLSVLDRFAASPLTRWWANYGLGLCAVVDTVGSAEEAESRCPVLRAVAHLKAGS